MHLKRVSVILAWRRDDVQRSLLQFQVPSSQHEDVRVRARHLTMNNPGDVHLSPLLLVTIVTSGTSGENDE